MKKRFAPKAFYALVLLVVLISSFLTPALLATRHIPIGTGPDELGHLEYTFSRLANPELAFQLEKGIYAPGYGPRVQGHQPPLSYWIGARVLSLFLEPKEVGTFFDYQSGLAYSSEGYGLGGESDCAYRYDQSRADMDTQRFRRAVYALRLFNSLLFTFSVLLTFLSVRLLLPDAPLLALSAAMLHAAIPTALWRSIYVTNDNLVSTFGSLLFYLSIRYMLQAGAQYRLVLLAAVSCGLGFLAKYNGVLGVGIVSLALVLKPAVRLRDRVLSFALLVLVFSALAGPDLYYNLSVDGDLFSNSYIVHVYPYLYKPSSFFTILTDPHIVPTILSRFWVNFNNLGRLDVQFPSWKEDVFLWTLALSFCGLFTLLFRRKLLHVSQTRVLLLCFGSILAALLLVMHFCTSFPMPAGRYIHLALFAFCLLIVIGTYSLLSLFVQSQAVAQGLHLLTAIFVLVFGHSTTFQYLAEKYRGCAEARRYNVSAGASVETADVDADGIDEILIFSRISPQLFVAKMHATRGYEIVPEWTRTVGLSADMMLVGDIDGDGLEDVHFWRSAPKLWFSVLSKEILAFDTAKYEHSDYAVTPVLYYPPTDGLALLADVNADAMNDLIVYQHSTPRWSVLLAGAQQPRFHVSRAVSRKFGGAWKKPFVLRNAASTMLGAYDFNRGLLYISRATGAQQVHTLSFFKDREILIVDFDGDGVSEIASWERAAHCLHVHSFQPGAQGLSLSSPSSLCLERKGRPAFGEHQTLRPIRNVPASGREPGRTPGSNLLSFDRRSGEILLFSLSRQEFSSDAPQLAVHSVVPVDLGFQAGRLRLH